MSKKNNNVLPEEKKEREEQALRHKAKGWVQVVLPGGKRRMMTAAGYEQWQANR